MKLPSEEKEKRMRLYDQGLTDREIAQRVGRANVSIFFWRRSMGLPAHPRARRKHRLDWEAITSDYRAGLNTVEIGRKYGTSPGHAHRILRRMGVTTRTPSEALLIKTHNWRRLSPMRGEATRILSLPAQFYKKLGFSRQDELEGRWVVKSGELVLEIRKRQREREQEC